MNGGSSQFARVLSHVESLKADSDRKMVMVGNSARAHAANMLASKPKEERERLDEQWDDTLFDGGLNWTITWNEGNLK